MFRDAKRALYVFLCGLMGGLLFLVIQRSLVLIYVILLRLNPAVFSLGLNLGDLIALDITTVFLALAGGGWYGIWVGLHWYDVVYERKTFPGLGLHLAEIFSIRNLRIYPSKSKGAKGASKDPLSFWQVEDLVMPSATSGNYFEPEEEKVVHIKPKSASSKPVVQKKTLAKKVVIKASAPLKMATRKKAVKVVS